ncbi:hypothetical protein NBO_39g0002 [Nosema bombycis CQ1]|uniref:Uncharacterized protein n=1 Tax=Nosema bombycis (strain CQ1 / CVCC 102059) TaxID=578461 RepID=R0M7W7_NOSB1|nr:hypothetical protein NBO_39g0002 [Nosema bombycis CQ1]|eukprot:EOB14089.1 hypothetical protein NBO_39g0002 [Nosema bombycis CQ1]
MVFDKEVIPEIYYDVALTATPSDDVALFLNTSTYQKLCIRSNYKMAFCSSIQNHNEVMYCKRSKFRYSYGCATKVNFYSCLEDILGRIRKSSFIPDKCFKRMQVSVEGIVFKKSLTEYNYSKVLDKIQNNLHNSKRLGYRFELSVEGTEVGSAINLLDVVVVYDNFSCMEFKKFKIIYMSNLYYLNSLISGYSVIELFYNISLEVAIKDLYIKGTPNIHFLPKNIKPEKFYSAEGIHKIDSSFNRRVKVGKRGWVGNVK